MTNKPVKYDVFVKHYLHAVLDISKLTRLPHNNTTAIRTRAVIQPAVEC